MDTRIPAYGTIVAAAGWSEKTRAMAQRAAMIGRAHDARGVLVHLYAHGVLEVLRGLPRAGQASFHRARLAELDDAVAASTGFRFELQVHAGRGCPRVRRRVLEGASLLVFDDPGPWAPYGAWPRMGELACPALMVKRPPAGQYRRVLVLADPPGQACAAIGQARAIAPEAEIVLLSVLDRSHEEGLRSRRLGEEAIGLALQQRREEAYATLAGLAEEAGATVVRMVEQGHLPMLLRNIEERLGADLLVLGRERRPLWLRYLLRDLVFEAAGGSGCDVLLLPPVARQ